MFQINIPQAANFIPVSRFRMFGNIIPGVSNKYTKGSSETRTFVSSVLVTPGLLPTLKALPVI